MNIMQSVVRFILILIVAFVAWKACMVLIDRNHFWLAIGICGIGFSVLMYLGGLAPDSDSF